MTVALAEDVLRDYPTELSQRYQAVIRSAGGLPRIERLLELGEALLKYLAGIAAAEYVQAGVRSAEVEAFLADCGRGNVTTGKWLGVLERCVKANDRSILNLNLVRELPDQQAMAGFVKCVQIVKPLLQQAPDAKDPAGLVQADLRRGTPAATTIPKFLDGFVWWRNRCVHGIDERTPLPPLYKTCLNEPLEAAQIEALRFFDCLRRYPLARLTGVEVKRRKLAHHFVICRGGHELPLASPLVLDQPLDDPDSTWLLSPDNTPYIKFTFGQLPSVSLGPSEETGELFIVARGPEEPAEVQVDGRVCGRTGELLREIPLGQHTIRVSHKYFQPAEVEVTVTADEWEPIQVQLEPAESHLTVACTPLDARLTLLREGQELQVFESPGRRRVPAGTYVYRVEREGYEPEEGTCEVCQGQSHTLQPRLAHVAKSASPAEQTPARQSGPEKPASAATADAQRANTPTLHTDVSASRSPAIQPVGGGPPLKVITNSIGMKLALIPAGEFLMGSPETEQGRKDHEGPQHPVRITRPFYLGVYPVTVGQFRQFVKATAYKTEGEADDTGAFGGDGTQYVTNPKLSWQMPGFQQDDTHPVVCVSWHDAESFCRWLSELEDKSYRLPSEAEWEYACRAGSLTRYSFDDNEDDLGRYAWYSGNAVGLISNVGSTHPVGQKQPNAWGLYDMHGNVWEWCWDWYGNYASTTAIDAMGPDTGSFRMFRGGSWIGPARFCRSASRGGGLPSARTIFLGFRLSFSSVDQSGR